MGGEKQTPLVGYSHIGMENFSAVEKKIILAFLGIISSKYSQAFSFSSKRKRYHTIQNHHSVKICKSVTVIDWQ